MIQMDLVKLMKENKYPSERKHDGRKDKGDRYKGGNGRWGQDNQYAS